MHIICTGTPARMPSGIPATARSMHAHALPARCAAAALALLLPLVAAPARADLAAACTNIAATSLPGLEDSAPDRFTTAGCANASATQVCALAGTAGVCELNPDCPDDQIENRGCTPDNAATACCIQELVQPCTGCDLLPTTCASFCPGGPPPPPLSRPEVRDLVCADFADIILAQLIDMDMYFGTMEGCDIADEAGVCDLMGVEGPCRTVPECAGVETRESGCDDEYGEDTSCCNVILSKLSATADAEAVRCVQECGFLVPSGEALPPVAPAMSNFTDATCSTGAAMLLARVAGEDPAGFTTAGCDAADLFQICDIRGTVGRCESSSACPENQVQESLCTAADEDVSCCFEVLTKVCEGCPLAPLSCVSECGRAGLPLPDGGDAVRERTCADIADVTLVTLADQEPDQATSVGCGAAEPGLLCDGVGSAGPCSEVAACEGLPLAGDPECTPAILAEGCCQVFQAKACQDCAPEPVSCLESCL
eukprot:jgi/Ulvmu1/1693/UM116_0005.1